MRLSRMWRARSRRGRVIDAHDWTEIGWLLRGELRNFLRMRFPFHVEAWVVCIGDYGSDMTVGLFGSSLMTG